MDEIKACTKKELHKKLNEVPEKLLRDTINQVMADNRGLEINLVKFKKFVRQNEVKMVLLELGYL